MNRARRLVVSLAAAVPFLALGQDVNPMSSPRYAEAVEFASTWADLFDGGNEEKSFKMLASTFQQNLTPSTWHGAMANTNAQLGARLTKRLRRVWYDNPTNAPLPGLYAAVEFDSTFENAGTHFRYIILHSQDGAPFKVMRSEATFALNKSKGQQR